MDKKSAQIIQQLSNQLALERQASDQLADAIINGGMDRAFEALRFHELCRHGFLYPGVKVGSSPESKPKKKTKRSPNHPAVKYRWARPDVKNQEYWNGFNCEPFQPKPQDEDKED